MKLPDLPEYAIGPTIDGIQYKSPGLSKMQLRAIQREAAIWALEEAAKVCETTYQEYKSSRFVTLPQFAGGDDCADAIRALKEQIE